eukprot:805435_1
MMDPSQTDICPVCKEQKANKRCGGCKQIQYCSQKCQSIHWSSHKKRCKELRTKKNAGKQQKKSKSTKSFLHSIADNMRRHTATHPSQESSSCEEKTVSQFNECSADIVECQHWIQLNQMIKVNDANINTQTIEAMDKTQMVTTIDQYLHLLYHHNKNADLNRIVDHSGECDVLNCKRFQRHHRTIRTYKYRNTDEAVYHQIRDKIHCYFMHSHHIGHRIRTLEKDKLTYNPTDHLYDKYLMNQELVQISKTLQMNREKMNLKELQGSATPLKFSPLTQLQNDDKMYSFGYLFSYDKDDEFKHSDAIDVVAKYKSFQQEILDNRFCRISAELFASELLQSNLFVTTSHCKKNYQDITCEHLLSVLLYCNCTDLQEEFSKTYRENGGKNHEEFYWLGKFLTDTVQSYGMSIAEGHIGNFYHGINRSLSMPSFINQENNYVHIYGPLSTSSVYSVAAATFAGYDGIVVQFSAMKIVRQGIRPKIISPPYFDCHWLSKYSSEKEYLFLQSRTILRIENIYGVKHGYEYKIILNALRIIGKFIFEGEHDIDFASVLNELIELIIANRLSCNDNSQLTEYGKKICDDYFCNKQCLRVHWSTAKFNYPFMKKYFASKNVQGWIDLDAMSIIFPNLWNIITEFITIKAEIVEDVIRYFKQIKTDEMKRKINLRTIEIHMMCRDGRLFVDAEDLRKKYAADFDATGAEMTVQKEKQNHDHFPYYIKCKFR